MQWTNMTSFVVETYEYIEKKREIKIMKTNDYYGFRSFFKLKSESNLNARKLISIAEQ